MLDMSDKIALITGASSGIGEAIARQFAALGAKLILIARRADRLAALAAELATECHCITLDITDRTAVHQTLTQLPEAWRNVDILVNNAGLAAGLAGVADGDVDDWEAMINTNLKGLLYVSKALLPGMLARNNGHIVNIGSIAGHEVYPNGAVYCATKHAVNAFSRGLKMDVHGSAIRVTSIDPGMVETEFSLVRFKGDQQRADNVYAHMHPLTPEDIADAVAYSATRPAHVNVSEMIILATDQSAATMVARHKEK